MVGRVLSCEKKARPAFLKKSWFYDKKTGFSRVGGIGNNAHVCCLMHKIKASLYNRVTGYGETDNPDSAAACEQHGQRRYCTAYYVY
jgi:hypothetical protein